LSLYAGRDLDAAHATIVGHHVDSCPSCDATVHKFGRTVSLLSAYGRLLETRPLPGRLLGGLADRFGGPTGFRRDVH
jgi:hypothetical protein